MNSSKRSRKTTASEVSAWVGCDVSKAKIDVAWCPPMAGGAAGHVNEFPVRSFPRTQEGVRQLLAWIDEQSEVVAEADGAAAPVRMVMEATGRYSIELAIWLREERPALCPAIVNPELTSAFIKSLGVRNKTDQQDARGLACFGSDRRPAPYRPAAPEYSKLQQLSRCRDDLVALRVAEQNRLKEPCEESTVRKMHKRTIAQLTASIKELEQKMLKAVRRNPKLQADSELLQSIYGVGFLVAAVVLAELGDLALYETSRQLTAFAGLSPRKWESGTSVRKQTHLCKKGPSKVRAILHLAALTVQRGNSDLSDYYHRLIAAGKKPMAALGAISRKLLVLMRAILISRIPYQPHFNTMEANLSTTCG